MATHTRKLRVIELFAGAGGGSLAAKWIKGWRTICYVEWAKYPASVIAARIADGWLTDAPIWDNVRTFDGRPWAGYADVVSAGFPCQPFSVAGKRSAGNDLRNGWPDTIRIVGEAQPRYVWLENVPGLLSANSTYCECGANSWEKWRGFWRVPEYANTYCSRCKRPLDKTNENTFWYYGTVLRDLAALGYDARWGVLSASRCGAPHKRERVWIAATLSNAHGKQTDL